MAKSKKKKTSKLGERLSINGSFEDVIRLSATPSGKDMKSLKKKSGKIK